jgi:aminoglycoside phosphotransferase (APT) family kinase protein
VTTASHSRWPQAERLNAQAMVDAVEYEAGVCLRIEGPCPGGQVGAAYVIWPDNHRSVLTWRPATRLADLREGPLAVMAAARSAGYPAPAVELAVQVGDAVALVWELLPGTPPSYVTSDLLDQALALNEQQADLLADRPTVPQINLYLTTDGPGFCLHEPLRAHSARTRALHRWISSVGASHPLCLAGADAVHCDYQPTNILADQGLITGVVDWDGAARGDRRLDLVTLRFGLHATPADPAATQRLDRILDDLPDQALAPLWAHMSLRMTDWAIRHFSPADVDHWLDLAEQRVH